MEHEVLKPATFTARVTFPAPDYRHLLAMTDSTGMLQHATYCIPNRNDGYCTDDNARALIVACNADTGDDTVEVKELISLYLSFLLNAFDADRRLFLNFMSYDRRWQNDNPDQLGDCHGRALWALGVASQKAPFGSQREFATDWFRRGLPDEQTFRPNYLRPRAFTILGIDRYVGNGEVNNEMKPLLESFANDLYRGYEKNQSDTWYWFEDIVTYDNAILPWALLVAAHRLNNEEMRNVALKTLRWLIDQQTAVQGHLTIIGNQGWMPKHGTRARFDQQPLEAGSLALACSEAYAMTGDPYWHEKVEWAFNWFNRDNDLQQPVRDPETGGCRDGLQGGEHTPSVNVNQGAESTLAWLFAQQCWKP